MAKKAKKTAPKAKKAKSIRKQAVAKGRGK